MTLQKQPCACCRLEALRVEMIQCPFCQAWFCQDDPSCLADHLCKGGGQSSIEEPDLTPDAIAAHEQTRLSGPAIPPPPPPPVASPRAPVTSAGSTPASLPTGGSLMPVPTPRHVRLRATNGGQTRIYDTRQQAANGLGVTIGRINDAMVRNKDMDGWSFAWVDSSGNVLSKARQSRKSRLASAPTPSYPPRTPSRRPQPSPVVAPAPAAIAAPLQMLPLQDPTYALSPSLQITSILTGLAAMAGDTQGLQLEDVSISMKPANSPSPSKSSPCSPPAEVPMTTVDSIIDPTHSHLAEALCLFAGYSKHRALRALDCWRSVGTPQLIAHCRAAVSRGGFQQALIQSAPRPCRRPKRPSWSYPLPALEASR